MSKKKSNLIELLLKTKVQEGEDSYSKEEIYNVLNSLSSKDIDCLTEAYGSDYMSVLEVDDDITLRITSNIIPKIRKKLSQNRKLILDKNTSSKNVEITSKPLKPNAKVVPTKVIKNILATKSLSEVEQVLTLEEAILLILRLGSSNLGMYMPDALAHMFDMEVEEVQKILNSAINKYISKISQIVDADALTYQKKLNTPKGK